MQTACSLTGCQVRPPNDKKIKAFGPLDVHGCWDGQFHCIWTDFDPALTTSSWYYALRSAIMRRSLICNGSPFALSGNGRRGQRKVYVYPSREEDEHCATLGYVVPPPSFAAVSQCCEGYPSLALLQLACVCCRSWGGSLPFRSHDKLQNMWPELMDVARLT